MEHLGQEMEQEKKKQRMLEIKLRNSERAREDAENRNRLLEKEMEDFFSTLGDLALGARTSDIWPDCGLNCCWFYLEDVCLNIPLKKRSKKTKELGIFKDGGKFRKIQKGTDQILSFDVFRFAHACLKWHGGALMITPRESRIYVV